MKAKKSAALDLKYPRLSMAVLIIVAVITFFTCSDVKAYLERLILPNVGWGFLKAFVQTAIFMSYLVPMVIAYPLLKSKYGPLQVAGMFFGGIVLGIISRIALIVVGILSPYG
jgi:hypothetical protein